MIGPCFPRSVQIKTKSTLSHSYGYKHYVISITHLHIHYTNINKKVGHDLPVKLLLALILKQTLNKNSRMPLLLFF